MNLWLWTIKDRFILFHRIQDISLSALLLRYPSAKVRKVNMTQRWEMVSSLQTDGAVEPLLFYHFSCKKLQTDAYWNDQETQTTVILSINVGRYYCRLMTALIEWALLSCWTFSLKRRSFLVNGQLGVGISYLMQGRSPRRNSLDPAHSIPSSAVQMTWVWFTSFLVCPPHWARTEAAD